MSNRRPAFVFSLVKWAWIIYVAVVAIWGAIDLSLKHGITGFFLGLVLGILVGAMSASVWAFVLYLIFRFGRSIFLWFNPSAREQALAAKKVLSPMTRREKVMRFFLGLFLIALGFGGAGDAASYNGNDAPRTIIICSILAALCIFGGLKLIRSTKI